MKDIDKVNCKGEGIVNGALATATATATAMALVIISITNLTRCC